MKKLQEVKLRKLIKEEIRRIKLNEWLTDKKLENLNNKFYSELVADSGKSDTVEGEMLRAINKIIYRYYNDGDFYFRGYGAETAGSAHAYLITKTPLKNKLSKIFSEPTIDSMYERELEKALKIILDYIVSQDGNYTKNSIDMLKVPSLYSDDDDDEYEDEDF